MFQELLTKLGKYGADIKGLSERFLGDMELYEKCLKIFFNDEYTAKINDAVNNEDWARAFEEAHKLKGVAGNLGLTQLFTDTCALVEVLRGGNCDRQLVIEKAKTVEKEYNLLLSIMV